MRRQNRMNDGSKDRGRIKPTAVFSMAGALVGAAILLSGLSLIGSESSQSAIAQEQTTTDGTSGGGSSTSTASNTTAVTGGSASRGGNATSTTGGGGGTNQSTSEIRMSLEQARTALQNNDTQSAMTFLDKALGAMGTGGTEGNMTSSSASSGGNATTTGESEGVSVGGTSAADDYDETPDAGG